MIFRKKVLLVAALALTTFNVSAQVNSANVVRIIVPFTAGGPTDVLARVIAPKLGERLKQNVIVENRAGATGAIGAQYVAHAAPDGMTLMLGTSSVMTSSPLLAPGNPFDPIKDFTPVSTIAVDENILVVAPTLPVKSVQELIDYAKANPNKLFYSTSGTGSSYHLGTELFSARAGIKVTHVPYKGTAQAMQDLMAGHVQMMFGAVSTASPYIKTGKMHPLGIASLKRHPDFMNLAPIADVAGLRGFEFATWMGLFLPAKTPQPIVDHTRAAMAEVMKSPDIRARIKQLGMQPMTNSPKEITSMIEKDLAQWGKVIKDAGIKAE
jgi:tripartite-type tricarboxylate transporter receptor subunit TctC